MSPTCSLTLPAHRETLQNNSRQVRDILIIYVLPHAPGCSSGLLIIGQHNFVMLQETWSVYTVMVDQQQHCCWPYIITMTLSLELTAINSSTVGIFSTRIIVLSLQYIVHQYKVLYNNYVFCFV